LRIGILTGGGDAPGLNAVIRAIVRKGMDEYGHVILGFRDGWAGAMQGSVTELSIDNTRWILPRGGTILGTSRTNPYKTENGAQAVLDTLSANRIDALIPIGGEDTLGVAAKLATEGVNVVGVPKTIDNDLSGTDVTFGFDTAVQIATDALDRLHTTAESHHRVMVVEVMGRHAGWIATQAGIAGGAHVILVPEMPFDIDKVARHVKKRVARGRMFSIIVVAEGATPQEGTLVTQEGEKDSFGHVRLGGIGNVIAQEIEKRTGVETRVTTLGHVQRGGTPTAFDRVLATRFGVAAIDAAHNEEYGVMVALRGTEIVTVPIEEATAQLKTIDPKLYAVAEVFFG
jgi:ATP-dependent phosphofructokinase / diphosphate-dependent phosphofructokinase